VKKIDLSSTKWLVDKVNNKAYYATGFHTFAYANLSACTSLKLTSAKFAYENILAGFGQRVELSTAYQTFYNADLSTLPSLSLGSVYFSVANMNVPGSVYTARSTFQLANLSKVGSSKSGTLGLSNAMFASTNMTIDGNSIETASETFSEANLSALTSLYLSGAIFVAQTMSSLNNIIYTAYQTFNSCQFTNLETLSFDDTEFAKYSMVLDSKTIRTAYDTFANISFPLLSLLSFSNAKFSATLMTNATSSNEIYTASETFSGSSFFTLGHINLIYTTFANGQMTTTDGTVHTGFKTFERSTLKNLRNLDLSRAKLGDSNDGDNTIDSTFFESLRDSP
jgi:hypothetical protein